MFITENQNVAESILFLLSARETLSCMVEASSVDHKGPLKNFLMNEASDYEIIHMLMYEEMPAEKYNFANEIRLFSDLKEQILVNYNSLEKYMGESVQTFINEVDTVYPDFSSAAPVLEFQLATQDNILSEVFDKEGVGVQKVLSWLGATGRKALTMGKDEVAMLKLTNKGLSPQAARKAITQQKVLIKKVAEPGAYIKAKGLGMTIVGDAKEKVAKGMSDVAGLKAGAQASIKQQASVASGKAAGVLASIKAKAIAAAPALQKAVTSQAGMAVGGAALAALALYASVKLYKRFMSKAAKSCAGQAGSAKTACMKKYQHGAIAAQVKDLGSAMQACAKSKSPEKCKVPIQKKISNLQVKMQKMKARMAA